jgi:hypothetical protein
MILLVQTRGHNVEISNQQHASFSLIREKPKRIYPPSKVVWEWVAGDERL